MSGKQRVQKEYVQGLVADAATGLVTDRLLEALSDCEMSFIKFYSSDTYATEVFPTVGVVDVTLSPDGENFRTLTDGSFLAADANDPDRTALVGYGLSTHGKITLTGVDVAVYFKACFYKV